MTGPTAVELDGDVSDVIAMLTGVFPGWSIVRTDTGTWWATRGGLVRESLVPDGRTVIKAAGAAEMYVRLSRATP